MGFQRRTGVATGPLVKVARVREAAITIPDWLAAALPLEWVAVLVFGLWMLRESLGGLIDRRRTGRRINQVLRRYNRDERRRLKRLQS